ncbi:hypothetical protein P5V15_002879 [Pogonomyrmex californicus]
MAIIKEHIRFSIHFAFHLKKNAAEATAMICAAYGENAFGHSGITFVPNVPSLPLSDFYPKLGASAPDFRSLLERPTRHWSTTPRLFPSTPERSTCQVT